MQVNADYKKSLPYFCSSAIGGVAPLKLLLNSPTLACSRTTNLELSYRQDFQQGEQSAWFDKEKWEGWAFGGVKTKCMIHKF